MPANRKARPPLQVLRCSSNQERKRTCSSHAPAWRERQQGKRGPGWEGVRLPQVLSKPRSSSRDEPLCRSMSDPQWARSARNWLIQEDERRATIYRVLMEW